MADSFGQETEWFAESVATEASCTEEQWALHFAGKLDEHMHLLAGRSAFLAGQPRHPVGTGPSAGCAAMPRCFIHVDQFRLRQTLTLATLGDSRG
jgi:hypothetical protein